MSKSDYSYHTFQNVIVIEDHNLGGMSVTNDIENVVNEISSKENIYKEDYVWVYKDSTDTYDGWDARLERFFHIGAKDEQSAIYSLEVKSRIANL